MHKQYELRSIVNIAITVFIALIVNQYYSFTHEYWLVLTAFMCSLSFGAQIQHSIKIFLSILAALICATLLSKISNLFLVYFLYGIFFITINYFLFLLRPIALAKLFIIYSFLILLLIAILLPPINQEIKFYLFDIFMGGLISILFTKVFLSFSVEKKFKTEMASYLQKFLNYSTSLIKFFSLNDETEYVLIQNRMTLEESLLQRNHYPEWVYERGFNPGLRAGYRYFLIHLERAIDLYVALHFLLTQKPNDILQGAMKDSIISCLLNNHALLLTLEQFFATQNIAITQTDFISDMQLLEKTASKLLPESMELLDISPDYTNLATIVRNIKDMREVLLQLNAALPKS